jgi:hypothetical protein
MEIFEVIFAALGVGISVITFFLKKESRRVDQIEDSMLQVQKNLTRNNCRDDERWHWVDKNMEDRREDIRKLFDLIRDVEQRACDDRRK